jgi:hypothetical protein
MIDPVTSNNNFFHARKITTLLLCLALALVAIVIFGPACHYPFSVFDDDVHITQNSNVKEISFNTVRTIWTSKGEAQTPANRLYIPLTLTSFQLEHLFFRLNPFYYHLTNLSLHILSAILVFLIFRFLLSSNLFAFFSALIFAVHPLQVEPVVWISGRKDVLCSFFYLAAFLSYLKHAASPGKRYIWATFILFLFSLL